MAKSRKPHVSECLATNEIMGLNSTCSNEHGDRIARLALLKQRAKKQEDYLFSLLSPRTDESEEIGKIAYRLKDCSSWLLFRDYYTIEQKKLHKKNSCKIPLLCPSCSALRASKMIQRVSRSVELALAQNRKLKPVLITLTVKNGEDLAERFNHLMTAFRKLQSRYRDYFKKGRGFNEFCKIDGAFYSTEYTYNKKTGEWHPHIHIFALLNDWIDQTALSELWFDVTGDSFIVDVRRVRKTKEHGFGKAVAEVCKYALKFSDLSVEKTWNAYKILKGKRLAGSLGSLWGIKEPEDLTDDFAETNDLPFFELFYRFVYDKKSFYNLTDIKHYYPNDCDYERRSEKEQGDRPIRPERI